MNEQSTYLPRPVTEPDVAPTPTTIHALLATWAALTPEAIAIGAPGRPGLTYRRLNEQVGQVAAALAARGLGRGARLAIVLPNGPEMAVAFLCAAALSTCAPLNPAYRAEEFAFYLADLGATALLVQAGDCSPVIAVAREQGIPVIELTPLADAAAGLFALTGQSAGAGRPLDLAQSDDTALVLHTSGTTARPKIVPLTQRNLCCSAAHTWSALALTSADRCLNIMPLFHIHGLIGAVLASLVAGGSVICTPGFDAPLFFDWLDLCRPTWYTAVPTMHQAILARSDAGREIILRRPLRFIRSASSALAPRVGQDLERAFGAPVVQAYGMTEAAHQVAGNPLPPRVRKSGSVGLAAGPEVAVMDDGGRLLGAGETGEVVIRGPNVMRGYDNNDEATGTAFAHGWFRTGDQGYLDSEGYLFLTGRLKELINRGGEKIAPREVDDVLLEHPAVAQAITFAAPHPRLGEEVAAAVVLRAGAAATEQDLRVFAAARLADFKTPRRVLIVDQIPSGPTGKPRRLGLAEALHVTWPDDNDSYDQRQGFQGPRTPLEQVVADIWQGVLRLDEIDVRDGFLRLGGDSLLAGRILARIQAITGIELSPITFFEAPTITGVAAALKARGARANSGDTPPAHVSNHSTEAAWPDKVAGERRAYPGPYATGPPGQAAPFSCALVGSGPLLIQCAELLLANGHTVVRIRSRKKITSRFGERAPLARCRRYWELNA